MKKDAGTLFESQERCRIIKVKIENENFFVKILTEETVGNVIKYVPTVKIIVSKDIPLSIMKNTTDANWPKHKSQIAIWKIIFLFFEKGGKGEKKM